LGTFDNPPLLKCALLHFSRPRVRPSLLFLMSWPFSGNNPPLLDARRRRSPSSLSTQNSEVNKSYFPAIVIGFSVSLPWGFLRFLGETRRSSSEGIVSRFIEKEGLRNPLKADHSLLLRKHFLPFQKPFFLAEALPPHPPPQMQKFLSLIREILPFSADRVGIRSNTS